MEQGVIFMEMVFLVPQLKINLAGILKMKDRLQRNPMDESTRRELSRLESMIQSLETQISFLED